MGSSDILTGILAHKRAEVTERRRTRPLPRLKEDIRALRPARPFVDALRARVEDCRAAVIAEIKQASPSKGVIREDFCPADIARAYEKAGATCLSVLTDARFFQGADAHLQAAKSVTSLPVLRKDFIVDAYQVYEARAIGADCILLIVGGLNLEELHRLYDLAGFLGMDVLVEVHDAAELEAALTLSPDLVGINNRDLETFSVDLDVTLDLLPGVPAGVTVVTESGIHRSSDVETILSAGVYGFLVGEALMRDPDPGSALARLFCLPGAG